MITECGGDTAHDAAVPGGRTRVFLIDEAAGLKRFLAAINQRERTFRRVTNAAPVHLHPFHPTARHVRRVETARRQQRLSKQQCHRGVVIIWRVLRRCGKIGHAGGKLFGNRLARSQVLGRNAQLVAGHECQQRAPRTRYELGLHWPAN